MQSTPNDILTSAILLFTISSVVLGIFSFFLNKASINLWVYTFLHSKAIGHMIIIPFIGFVIAFGYSIWTLFTCAKNSIVGNGVICANIHYWVAFGIAWSLTLGGGMALYLASRVFRERFQKALYILWKKNSTFSKISIPKPKKIR